MLIMMSLWRSSAQVDRIIDAVGVENIRENVVMDKMQVRSPIFINYLTKCYHKYEKFYQEITLNKSLHCPVWRRRRRMEGIVDREDHGPGLCFCFVSGWKRSFHWMKLWSCFKDHISVPKMTTFRSRNTSCWSCLRSTAKRWNTKFYRRQNQTKKTLRSSSPSSSS